MKRIILIMLILVPLGAMVVSARKVTRRHVDGRAPVQGWEWSGEALPPRPDTEPHRRGASASLRFARSDTRREVRIADGAVVIQIGASGAPAPAAEADEPAPTAPAPPAPSDARRVVQSDLRVTEFRAREDLRDKVRAHVKEWLRLCGVGADWTPPASMVDALVIGSPRIEVEERDYAQLYRASTEVDFSAARQHILVKEYHRQVAEQRLGLMGGVLVFVLACLGVVTSYVRADEATKGYFTNRLRLVAAAAVGASGVLLYRWLTRT